MKELKCPNCGSVFSVDEADYAFILSQVKNSEFEAEIKRRLAELHQQHLAEQKAVEVQQEKEHQAALTKKDQEISRKEMEIAQLKAQIAQSESRQQIAVMEVRQKAQGVLSQKDAEIARLKADAEVKTAEAASSLAVLREQYEGKLKSAQEQVEY